MSLPFPETARTAFILYRILQLRYATRDQIKQHFFKGKKGIESLMTNHVTKMIEEGYLEEKRDILIVTNKGFEKLLSMLNRKPKKHAKDEYYDKLPLIDRDFIEKPVNIGNLKNPEHRLITSDVLLHFIKKFGEIKTRHFEILEVTDLENIKPDHIFYKDNSVNFIEVEHKNQIKDLKNKLARYIRYYFSGDFSKKYGDDKYMRVFVVEMSPNKLKEIMNFLLSLNYKKLGFNKRVHSKHDHIGRNLFRFSGPDFKWIKVQDWSKHKHNGGELRYVGVAESEQ